MKHALVILSSRFIMRPVIVLFFFTFYHHCALSATVMIAHDPIKRTATAYSVNGHRTIKRIRPAFVII